MTKTWIQANFPARDIPNTVAVMAEGPGEIVVDIDWLAGQIGTAATYADLTALAISAQGWQKVWDQWKQKGIVS